MASAIGTSKNSVDYLSEQLASVQISELQEKADAGDREAQFQFAKKCAKAEDRAYYLQLAADQWYIPAQLALATCFLHGIGVPQDLNQAVRYLGFAANAYVKNEEEQTQKLDAQLAMGNLLLEHHSQIPGCTERVAAYWFNEVAKSNSLYHKHAASVAIIRKWGATDPQYLAEAIGTILKIAYAGYIPSLLYLADYYANNNQEPIGYGCLKRAANLQDPDACYLLAEWTFAGKGCKPNESLGWEYMRAAASVGSEQAQSEINREDARLKELYERVSREDNPALYIQIVQFYDIGIGSTRIDRSKSLHYLGLAAAKNHPEACYSLGLRFANGDGAECDSAKAYQFFKRAAELDFSEALQRCREYEDFFENTKQRADVGSVKDQFEVAQLYAKGIGVEKDDSKCIDYLNLAEQAGYVPAMLELGSRFAKGNGVFKNVLVAANYFKKALETSREEASSFVDNLLKEWAKEINQLRQKMAIDRPATHAWVNLSRDYDLLNQALNSEYMN